jgi:hypothetical protein
MRKEFGAFASGDQQGQSNVTSTHAWCLGISRHEKGLWLNVETFRSGRKYESSSQPIASEIDHASKASTSPLTRRLRSAVDAGYWLVVSGATLCSNATGGDE